MEFYRDNATIIYFMLAVQEISAESDLIFPLAERDVRLAKNRQLCKIADMSLVKTFLESIRFDNGTTETKKNKLNRLVQYALHNQDD